MHLEVKNLIKYQPNKTSSVLKAKYIMIQVWIPTSTPGLKTSQELLSELIQQQLHLLY